MMKEKIKIISDGKSAEVYVDGKKADIRDIEAGNVLTVIGSKLDIANEKITTIHASTKTVTGEATRVKKSNNAITIDGDVYTATKLYTKNERISLCLQRMK